MPAYGQDAPHCLVLGSARGYGSSLGRPTSSSPSRLWSYKVSALHNKAEMSLIMLTCGGAMGYFLELE